MAFEEASARGGARPYIRYNAELARVIVWRVAAGEPLRAICRDPDMPAASTVARWARERGMFGRVYHRAKALAQRTDGLGPTTTYCEATAREICLRVAEGESLTAIAADPAMPALWSIMHWQRKSHEFAAALSVAKEARAERMADQGCDMAMAATPETAHVTRVRLGQLRWRVAILSPRTHGRTRPADPPAPPPEPQVFLFKHYTLEEHPQTGLVRVVTYLPDIETRQPVRVAEGAWSKKPAHLREPPDIAEV